MRSEAGVRISILPRSSVPNVSEHFSAKRRMGPVCRIVFRQNSSNAFIPVLPESKAFLFSGPAGKAAGAQPRFPDRHPVSISSSASRWSLT